MKNKMIDLVNHTLGLHGFDYDEINEEVIIGTNMCCQYGFEKELLVRGVTADVSLEKDKVDAPKGVQYFLWLPTEDEHAPTQDQLTLGVEDLTFFKARNIKVYIHCKNGHGRATTLYMAFLMKNGMGLDQALASIKEKRPGVHLTEEQLRALKTFAQGSGK